MMIKFSYYLALLALLSCSIAVSAQELDIKSVPTSISNLYSDVDMRMRLAAKPNTEACSGEQCVLNRAFDKKVKQVGERLASVAYDVYPDLSERVPKFTFKVVDIKESGMASNGAGKIVVFRGIQYLNLNEDAVAFILAREMGHVIGRHHKKNTSTRIIFTVLTTIFFPAVTLFSASNVAAQATTSAVTSVASTATSYFGSEAVISTIKPRQLTESDDIAITLLEAQDWNLRAVASGLQFDDAGSNGWLQDLHTTAQYLNHMIDKADTDARELKAMN